MRYFKTIQGKLFISFTIISVLITLTFGFLSYFYIQNTTVKELEETEKRTANNILALLDSQLKNMDLISNQIIFSKVIKENINKLIYHELTPADELNCVRLMSSTLSSYIGPYSTVWQINIFNDKIFINEGINHAYPDEEKLRDTNNSAYVKEAMANSGRSVIIPPAKDLWNVNNDNSVSLIRLLSGDVDHPSLRAIIEVQSSYNLFKQPIESNADKRYKTFVYNGKGDLIYPMVSNESNSSDMKYYYSLVNGKQSKGTFINKNSAMENEFIAFSRSSYSNWVVIMVTPENTILSATSYIKKIAVFVLTASILLVLIISFLVSRKISKPIKQINRTINDLHLGNLTSHALPSEASNINELESLYSAFDDMRSRLKISINEAIQSRSRELKAQLLALQSQMSPHFLYNTLTIIAVTSEERGQQDIFMMCKELTSMLRYISSGYKADVKLEDELKHTTSYLNLMKFRYEHKLQWDMELDDSLIDTPLPKLTIQPLIENCIQHGFKCSTPPWNIKIRVKRVDDTCKISIIDNGTGFEANTLEKLKLQMQQYSKDLQEGNEAQSLEIGGMGLINIYARLKLTYKETLKFNIVSSSSGTDITIGIPLSFGGME